MKLTIMQKTKGLLLKNISKTGKVTNYKTYEANSQNPSGFQEVKGYDGIGTAHTN